MAKLEQGILGAFSGRVGTVVGYTWRGRSCVRAYQRVVAYPNTVGQQLERDWFVAMVRFASRAKAALKLGMRHRAYDAQMTEGNYFVFKNKQHFTRNGDLLRVDYARLSISEGPAADVYFKAPQFAEGEVVSVDFEKNSLSLRASSEDSVYLFAYAPGVDEGYLSAPALRRSKTLKMNLPQHWAGAEVHLYGFVVDREGRSSNSTYIGTGRVDHREDSGRYVQITNEWSDFVDIAGFATAAASPASATAKAVDPPAAAQDAAAGAASLRSAADPPGGNRH
ncbi:MAG: hypothetical protein J6I49_08560 [Bacteroidales bacterium]|nr:hypothetical protein [Bacteroidales bacterium]